MFHHINYKSNICKCTMHYILLYVQKWKVRREFSGICTFFFYFLHFNTHICTFLPSKQALYFSINAFEWNYCLFIFCIIVLRLLNINFSPNGQKHVEKAILWSIRRCRSRTTDVTRRKRRNKAKQTRGRLDLREIGI